MLLDDVRESIHWRIPAFQHAMSNFFLSIKGFILQNRVNTFWYTGVRNFGDLLTPSLLNEYGMTPFNIKTSGVDGEQKLSLLDFVGVGSILQRINSDFRGIILGSGLIREESGKQFARAMILGLRGELTKKCIGCHEDVVLGDPGLLAVRLLKTRMRKKYLLGFIPHYSDEKMGLSQKFLDLSDTRIIVISPQRSPMKVIQDIDQCEYIVSSSLHGLIVADSLGIPNGRLVLSDKIVGGDFKYDDYYSALGVTRGFFSPKTREPLESYLEHVYNPPVTVLERREQLHNLFLRLKECVEFNRNNRRD